MGVSDDLKIVSGEVMPADLREKLKALVEEMRERAGSPAENRYVRLNLYWYADQLAALLAESEPEPPKPEPCSEWEHCPDEGKPGHFGCDVLCAACGFPRGSVESGRKCQKDHVQSRTLPCLW